MIFFIYGPDDFRAKEKIRELKDKFLREVDQSGSSLIELSGDDLNLEKFHELVSANSLFARRRFLLMEKTLLNKNKDFLSAITTYLTDNAKSQENILLFYEPQITMDKKNEAQLVVGENTKPLNKSQKNWFDFLLTTAHAQYFAPLNGQELATWLKERLSKVGFSIDYKATQMLSSMLGGDLWALNNELNKLVHYQSALEPDNKIIKAETVLAMVQGQSEEKIFALTDAIGNKNKALALALLEDQLRQGQNDVYLMTMLGRQVKILLAVRSALDNGFDAKKIAQAMKLHPYVLQKSINQARNFNSASLKALLTALVRMDYNYKTGKLPTPLMMDLLLAKI